MISSRTQFLSPKSPSFFIRETALSPVLFWPDYLHRYNMNSNDHMSFLKSASLECYKEISDWILIRPSGQGSQATQSPSCFACNTYSLGDFLRFLRSPKCVEVLSLTPFRKATFVPYPERPPWTFWISKVPGHFSEGLLLASSVNLNFFSLSGNIQSPGTALLITTFQTKTWLLKPQLETVFMRPVIKKLDFYWIYTNILPWK